MESQQPVTQMVATIAVAVTRRCAWDRRWSEASVLRAQGSFDVAFPRFWALTCDALTLEDETRALAAAHVCYEPPQGTVHPEGTAVNGEIHLPQMPEAVTTRCGRPLTAVTSLAAVPMYATCGDCLMAAKRGHEGGVREDGRDADREEHEHGYGHGV
jgi:hypothetical protein